MGDIVNILGENDKDKDVVNEKEENSENNENTKRDICPFLKEGTYVRFSKSERKKNRPFTLRTISPFVYSFIHPITNNQVTITVPTNFLSDGASWAPDVGCSWIFHDYLYATHKFDDGSECSFDMANNIMLDICSLQRNRAYRLVVSMAMRFDFIGKFRSSWNNALIRGPKFYCQDQEEVN